MRDHVAFLLFVSLLAIVVPKGNEGYYLEENEGLIPDVSDEFLAWDQNKDNYLDTKELSTELKPAYVEYVLKNFDVDGDGKINYEELIKEFLNWPNSGWLQSDAFYTDT